MARVRLEEKPKPRIVLCMDGGGALGVGPGDLLHDRLQHYMHELHLEEDRKLFAEIKAGKHPTCFSIGSKGSACSNSVC